MLSFLQQQVSPRHHADVICGTFGSRRLLIRGRCRHRDDKNLACVGISHHRPGRISGDVDLFSGYKRTFDQAVFAGPGGWDIVGPGNGVLRIWLRWSWRGVGLGSVGGRALIVIFVSHIWRRSLGCPIRRRSLRRPVRRRSLRRPVRRRAVLDIFSLLSVELVGMPGPRAVVVRGCWARASGECEHSRCKEIVVPCGARRHERRISVNPLRVPNQAVTRRSSATCGAAGAFGPVNIYRGSICHAQSFSFGEYNRELSGQQKDAIRSLVQASLGSAIEKVLDWHIEEELGLRTQSHQGFRLPKRCVAVADWTEKRSAWRTIAEPDVAGCRESLRRRGQERYAVSDSPTTLGLKAMEVSSMVVEHVGRRSGSERWRVSICVMAAIASYLRSPILVLDGADILDDRNKVALVRFLLEKIVPHFAHTLLLTTIRGDGRRCEGWFSTGQDLVAGGIYAHSN